MTWMAEDDNGGDDDNLPGFVRVVPLEVVPPAAQLDYWAVEPIGYADADMEAGERYFREAIAIAQLQGSDNILAAVLTSMIRKKRYGAIEAAWLSALARKSVAGGLPEPMREETLDEADRYYGSAMDRGLMREGENRACFDLIAIRSADELMMSIHTAMTTTGGEDRMGYLCAICRAAYAGSRH